MTPLLDTTADPTPGLRAFLRHATMADHQEIDALGQDFDLSTPAGYGAFLMAHAAVLPGLEDAVSHGPVPPDWPMRLRAQDLAADLSGMGLALPAQTAALDLPSAGMRIGALYVLEGSRLGGAVLRRRVQATQPGAPCAFLAHGAEARLWPSFVGWLDSVVLDEEELDKAAHGARSVFSVFYETLRSWHPKRLEGAQGA